MRVVGLTGGIACGKTTVVKFLKEDGFPIVDCDEISHHVTACGSGAYDKIVAKFGAHVICKAGPGSPIDRDALARIIFADKEARSWLNGVTHWRIGVAILQRLFLHWLRGDRVVILDAPLLFESGLSRICHPIVCVSLSLQMQIERLMSRDGIDGAFARAKVGSQMDTATKCARSQFVIENDGSREATQKRVKQICVTLASLSPGWWTRLNASLLLGLIVFALRWFWFH